MKRKPRVNDTGMQGVGVDDQSRRDNHCETDYFSIVQKYLFSKLFPSETPDGKQLPAFHFEWNPVFNICWKVCRRQREKPVILL